MSGQLFHLLVDCGHRRKKVEGGQKKKERGKRRRERYK
jgi:hypothetical protein